MSLTKRVWINSDPDYEDARGRFDAVGTNYKDQFQFRIPLQRRGSKGRPYWEPAWPCCVNKVVKELGLDTIQLNSGLYFRTQEDLDRARAAAEAKFAQLDI